MSKLIITEHGAKEAGEQINTIVREHTGDVVCLLAGGSALDIIEYIEPRRRCFHDDCVAQSRDEKFCSRNECRTIFMMGDERVSGEAEINNFLQLKTRYRNHPIFPYVIQTVPEAHETEKSFAERIEKTFLETLVDLENPKIIFVLGIGADGHTAGIFPQEAEAFRKTYQDDRTYVPVPLEGLKIDSRASFTPTWILNNADVLIGYAVGQSKREILLELNQTDKNLNERPAELMKLHKNVTVYTDQDIT